MAEHPKVFISYSHDSPEHKRWVLEPVLKSKLISESFHFTGKYPQNQLISPLK